MTNVWGLLALIVIVVFLAWLFIHLAYLVQFENRVLVMIQWAWGYVSWNRSARLITGTGEAAPRTEAGPIPPPAAGNATPPAPAAALTTAAGTANR